MRISEWVGKGKTIRNEIKGKEKIEYRKQKESFY